MMSLVAGWKVVPVNRTVLVVVEDYKLNFVSVQGSAVAAEELVAVVVVCSYCLIQDYMIAVLVVDRLLSKEN